MYLTIERNGKRFDTTVTPTLSERSGVGFAGWDERGEDAIGRASNPAYPAEKAGLKKGDLLVTVNGQPIHSRIKFQEITQEQRRQAARDRIPARRPDSRWSPCSRYSPSWTARRGG